MIKPRLSQMITVALAATCGVLLLLAFVLELGVGRGYRWWTMEAEESAPRQDQMERASFKLQAWDDYASIHQRPVFNEDRRPTPPAPPEVDTGKPIPKLTTVTLSGVILTPRVHVALIVENGKAQSTAVKEGGSLPGDLNAWTLIKVKPRGAVFKNAVGEEAELELIAKGSGLKPPQPAPPAVATPAPPVVPQPQPAAAPAATQTGSATEQASELQQRIDARRKQLQEQADRAKQQPPPQENL